MPGHEPGIAAGAVIAYRLFEVAYEIDLGVAERLWVAHTSTVTARSRFVVTPRKAVAFGTAPLVLALDPLVLPLEDGPAQANVSVRVFDFGVVSIALRVAIGPAAWSAFATRFEAMAHAVGSGAGGTIWSDLIERVKQGLGKAIIRPVSEMLEEDYLIGVVNHFELPLTAAALQERIDLAPLLSGELRALSESARQDLLRQRFSYYTDDLVVLAWDRAFIYEPRGDSDVIDVLEVANAQLLEMRYYNALLDAELPRMHDAVEAARRATSLFAPRRYVNLARSLYTVVAEVTELTEKVENALQVTGDVYLARVYTAALDLFRVPIVSAAAGRKLAIIRDTYAALNDEASARRAEWLEIAILVLILIEVILPLLR